MNFSAIVEEAINNSEAFMQTDKKGKPLMSGLVTNTGVYASPKLGSTAVGLAPHQFASSVSNKSAGGYMTNTATNSEGGEGNENSTDSKKLSQKFKTMKFCSRSSKTLKNKAGKSKKQSKSL